MLPTVADGPLYSSEQRGDPDGTKNAVQDQGDAEDGDTDAPVRPSTSGTSRPSTAAAMAQAAASMSLEAAIQAVRGTIDSRDIESLEALLGVVCSPIWAFHD
jgi:hypothetical protein